MLAFHKNWFYLAGCLFCVEVFIAAFLHDRLVRPYVGDLLAVVFLYCLVKSLAPAPVGPTVGGVLLVAYALEALQYVHLLAHLGLAHSRVAAIVLGSHFEWVDMLAYTLGALLILGAEKLRAIYNQCYA
ncbi:MAG: DUF2809 domain-containing protein [Hymenobacter sp.]|nr:MAG: DUF2809 domain-containing protein [Hymenobacter sp.]